MTILQVEDDPNDVLLLKEACRLGGLAVTVQAVNEGDAAIEYLSGRGSFADRAQYPMPALVLLDLKMPRKSGIEVLDWIRSQPSLKRLPVVIFSTSNHRGDIDDGYEHGANSYLAKPVSFEELIELAKGIHLYWLKLNQQPTV